jgi:hypothetical protein
LLSFFRTRSCSTTWKNIPIDRQRGSKGVSLHGVKFCCGITYWFSLWCYSLKWWDNQRDEAHTIPYP